MTERSAAPTFFAMGLDACCLPVREQVSDRTGVPTLRRSVETGGSGSFDPRTPPRTVSGRSSLYARKNPGKCDVVDSLSADGNDRDVVDATHVGERPVWELSSDDGTDEAAGHEFRADEFLRGPEPLSTVRGEGMLDWSRIWNPDRLDDRVTGSEDGPAAGESTDDGESIAL